MPRQHLPKFSGWLDLSVLLHQVTQESSGFWSRLESLGDEVTGLIMTKTKVQRGLLEPITHVRKPYSVQVETGGQQGPVSEVGPCRNKPPDPREPAPKS